jgi:hypothetical protein
LAPSEIRSTGIVYLRQNGNDIQWSTELGTSSIILGDINGSAINSTITFTEPGIYRIDIQMTSSISYIDTTNTLSLLYLSENIFTQYQNSSFTGTWTANNTQLNGHFMINVTALQNIYKIQLILGNTPWQWADNLLLSRCMISKIA